MENEIISKLKWCFIEDTSEIYGVWVGVAIVLCVYWIYKTKKKDFDINHIFKEEIKDIKTL